MSKRESLIFTNAQKRLKPITRRRGAIPAAVSDPVKTGGNLLISARFVLCGQNLVDTLNQIIFAIGVGLAFTMVYYKGGSLLPCILAHSFIDVCSVFAPDEGSQRLNVIVHVVSLVVCVAYAIYLMKRVETPRINRPDMQKESAPCPEK